MNFTLLAAEPLKTILLGRFELECTTVCRHWLRASIGLDCLIHVLLVVILDRRSK